LCRFLDLFPMGGFQIASESRGFNWQLSGSGSSQAADRPFPVDPFRHDIHNIRKLSVTEDLISQVMEGQKVRVFKEF